MWLLLAKGDSIKTLISDIKTIESRICWKQGQKAVGNGPVSTALAEQAGAPESGFQHRDKRAW